jgi:hypothetical protein
MVRLAGELGVLRGGPPTDRPTLQDAALAAMSGRIQVHEDQERSAEEVIAELLDAALATGDDDRATSPPTPPPAPPTPRPAESAGNGRVPPRIAARGR